MSHPLNLLEIFWLTLGFGGQILFGGRFLVQWIQSEKHRRSVIPISFWYFSILGGVLLLIYAIHLRDLVFISGQLFGVIVYVRNLYLIYNERKKTSSALSVS